MREIVLDTETTGLDPATGDRLVEIGCIELINHMPSGNDLHLYVNPERDMPPEAFRVHGLSETFLADKPLFAEVVDEFLAFIGEDRLIIHNAAFDMKFLNAELARLKRPPLPMSRALDTLRMAQARFPGAQASLDALCRRFGVDTSARTKHGALIDCVLLAEVYLELIGGREPGLALSADKRRDGAAVQVARPFRAPRPHAVSPEEQAAHEEFLKKVKDPLWRRAGSNPPS
ncbi:DNA polymerase III subunit epsilon [Rhodospirillum rubrum]|uniref:DNA polymerase III subunit epsilon n=1 Tax=Rhodospirillum rubrum TaxID=1085 RepID=UPI00190903F9|nr:DNA polymerase III subunit epsilon [Rhodospirillum rubrum]MBK1663217.1 DNA polymerase III subunit epsilon [Rhodospirillum rubrum]MBK1676954.1 DNA polymerase III subunit epsilon [Rhodospirillum rubrum]